MLDLHRSNPHGLWLPWDGQPGILRPLKSSVGKKLCFSFLGFESMQQPEGFISPPSWRTSLQQVLLSWGLLSTAVQAGDEPWESAAGG